MTVEQSGADTFPKLLLQHAMQRPERPAIREKSRGIWRTTTWHELAEEVAALTAALSARGLQRGAHVALLGDNRPRLYAAMCAAQALGAIAVPLYQDGTADEILTLLQKAEVTHVFAENQEQVDKVLAILPRCPAIRCIVYDKDRGMRHYKQPQLVGYADLLKEGREVVSARRDFLQTEAARGNGQDAAFLFFTSGTTGPAKGVVLTHASLIDRARVAVTTEKLSDTDVAMAYLPPGWIGQNLFSYVQPMAAGYCVCCTESSDTMLSDMREMGPTYFLATPGVLGSILTQVTMRLDDTGGLNLALYRRGMAAAERSRARARAGRPAAVGDRLIAGLCNFFIYGPLRDVLGLSKVRVAYTAGDPIDPDLLLFFRSLGINLKQLYGSTESGFFVALQRDNEVKPDTVGRATEGVELKITPEREILVRSPGLFKEYHRDPDLTARVRGADGWFHTGDAGYLDDEGHLRIIDRMKNVGALSDGTLYAPKVLENKLKFFTAIQEAVVFGDGRDKVCALIDIDLTAAGRWADRQTISYTGHADLASRDEIYALVGECIAKVNAELALDPVLGKSQIHRFAILQKELSPDDGMLTRTGKLRRDVIAERFRPLVDAMYAGRTEARIEDGGQAVELKICDAKVFPLSQARRAA